MVADLAATCPNLYSVLTCTPLTLADEGKAPSRFLLIRYGDVGWAGMKGFTLDDDSAADIIGEFKAQGTKIPIDYHHSTEKVRPGGKAPAAGHIGKLEYVKGDGLYAAAIEWTDEGRADVEARRFIYTSPAVIYKKTDKALAGISSVALTNKPRTIDADELVAAAELVRRETDDMAGNEKRAVLLDRVNTMAKRLGIKIVMNQEDELPEFPAVDAAQKAIADLIEVLKGKGAEVADDSPLEVVIKAAIELLGTDDTGDTEPSDGDGADEGAESDESAAAAEAFLKSEHYKKLSAEVKVLRGRLEKQDADNAKTEIEALLNEQVDANKLNPNDEKAMENARALAEANPVRFKGLFESIEPYAPPPTVPTTMSDGTVGPVGDRDRVKAIAEASREWNGCGGIEGFSKREFVDGHLATCGLDLLQDDETKALAL